jgi:NADPH2:quinone reductase
MTQMRAVLYDRTGPAPEVLIVAEVDRPEPGPGEVRVRVALSGINPVDVKVRGGAIPRRVDGPLVPHDDGVGVIDAVGAGVDEGRVGQRVWLWLAAVGGRWGTAAEWVVVPAAQAVPLPDTASDELGACLGVPALTAHQCVLGDGPVSGRTVLVQGGAGAVGHFAVQLARWSGARVLATVGSAANAVLARQAGAHAVVDHRDTDATAQLQAIAPVVDRIVEVALVDNFARDLALSRPGTTIVTYASDGRDLQLPLRACMNACVTLRFMLLYAIPEQARLDAVRDVSAALADRALAPLPVRHYSLDDAVAAHEDVEAGRGGKVVLDLRG